MHPLWLRSTNLKDFLAPLQAAGLNAFEFLLDPGDSQWSQFAPLMKSSADMGFYLSFHFPYRQAYSLQGFRENTQVVSRNELASLLSLTQDLGKATGHTPVIVVHAAKSKSASRQQLFNDTLAFMQWAVEGFPGLYFAIENLGPAATGELKLGDTREEVFDLVVKTGSPQVGICWDLGHDKLHNRLKTPPISWLEKVIHLHVHDVDSGGVDHYPLVYNNVPYRAWLPIFSSRQLPGSVCLEIKGHQLKGWGINKITQSLVDSVNLVRELVDE